MGGQLFENIIRFIWLVFFTSKLSAQNYIFNGEFEQFIKCPAELGMLNKCSGWHDPLLGTTPDYFNNCYEKGSIRYKDFINEASVPNNVMGYQHAHSGNGYVGIIVSSFLKDYNGKRIKKDSKGFYREYIQTKFIQTLTKGELYRLKFYISLGDSCYYYIDRIGVSFTAHKLEEILPSTLLSSKNSVTLLEPEKLKDYVSWQEITYDFIANGDENFLTIGLFDENITEREVKKMYKNNILNANCDLKYSYYFIDDVSLYKIDEIRRNFTKP